MDTITAGIVGACIGAAGPLIKSFLDSKSQVRLEEIKAESVGRGSVASEFRAYVSAVAKELMASQHSMEWLCSQTDGNAHLTPKAVAMYHTEIHGSFPRLLGALASVSSLDTQAYNALFPLAEKVFVVDAALASALATFRASPEVASQLVAAQRAAATRLYSELPVSIGRITSDLRQGK